MKKTILALSLGLLTCVSLQAQIFNTNFASNTDLEDNFWSPNSQAGAFQWEVDNGGQVRLNAGVRQEIIFDTASTGAATNRAGTAGANTNNGYFDYTMSLTSRIVNTSNNMGARLMINDAETSAYTVLMLGNGAIRLYDNDGNPTLGTLGTQLSEQSLTGFSFNSANYYQLSVDVSTQLSQVDFAVSVFDLGNSSVGTPVQIGSTLNFSDTVSPALIGQVGGTWNTAANNQLLTGFSVVPVPEPTSAALLLGGMTLLLVRRRR